jgi:hypothetical protein
MTAIVRRAVLHDCADIALLVRNYWTLEAIEGFDRRRITELLAAFLSHPEQGSCWVGDQRGSLQGYVLTSFMFSLEFGGLGAKMVYEAILDMKRAGLVHAQLQLGVENRRGATFYQRQGFSLRTGYQLWGRALQRRVSDSEPAGPAFPNI